MIDEQVRSNKRFRKQAVFNYDRMPRRTYFDFCYYIIGVLMEESSNAIEYMIFGICIQHYGLVYPKFQVYIYIELIDILSI